MASALSERLPEVGPEQEAQRVELTSLRSEIIVRIVFQNILLCLTWCSLGVVLAAARLYSSAEILLIYPVLATSAAGMWSHHGARTAQIRLYLQSRLEPALFGTSIDGWEHALAGLRFRSLLGSRWFVSTKGFFLGSQLLVAALSLGTGEGVLFFSLTLTGVATSAWLLHEAPLEEIR